jgi:hypothetical protein
MSGTEKTEIKADQSSSWNNEGQDATKASVAIVRPGQDAIPKQKRDAKPSQTSAGGTIGSRCGSIFRPRGGSRAKRFVGDPI